MIRLKCNSFTLRFWINDKNHLSADFADLLVILRNKINAAPPNVLLNIEAIVCTHFNPEHGIAAYEILSNSALNGVVGYVEWP